MFEWGSRNVPPCTRFFRVMVRVNANTHLILYQKYILHCYLSHYCNEVVNSKNVGIGLWILLKQKENDKEDGNSTNTAISTIYWCF